MLILSNEQDVSVDWVVRELRRRSVPYLRLNTERIADYQTAVYPDLERWGFQLGQRVYELDVLRSIWYRRPGRPIGDAFTSLSDAEQDLIAGQWQALIHGLSSLSHVRWINAPYRNAAAESKILQLRLAHQLGFRVPATVITNSRTAALNFLQDHPSGVVLKALYAPLLEEPSDPAFVFTRRIDVSDFKTSEEADAAPYILQEEISPKLDVRVTVINQQVFSAAVAQPLNEIDWRLQSPPVQFEPHQLPLELGERCRMFLKHLGLRFGAFDFVRTDANEYVFLELNPNGEWGWLQKNCGLPIAEGLVDALTNTDGYE